jgi:hypothetical protein
VHFGLAAVFPPVTVTLPTAATTTMLAVSTAIRGAILTLRTAIIAPLGLGLGGGLGGSHS